MPAVHRTSSSTLQTRQHSVEENTNLKLRTCCPFPTSSSTSIWTTGSSRASGIQCQPPTKTGCRSSTFRMYMRTLCVPVCGSWPWKEMRKTSSRLRSEKRTMGRARLAGGRRLLRKKKPVMKRKRCGIHLLHWVLGDLTMYCSPRLTKTTMKTPRWTARPLTARVTALDTQPHLLSLNLPLKKMSRKKSRMTCPPEAPSARLLSHGAQVAHSVRPRPSRCLPKRERDIKRDLSDGKLESSLESSAERASNLFLTVRVLSLIRL